MKKVKECGNSQTIAEYVYDYTGLRTVKKNYTTGTLANTVVSWSDSYESKTPVGGSASNTSYYWVNKELLAKKDNSGNRFYYQNDHLGSSTLLTNSGGSVAEQTKYDPWGKVSAGGTMSKFQYTGQEKDSETGLNYYNARYYSSDMRRFTQPDDIIQNAYNPQDLNRFAYVRNNPLRYTDPSGHVVTCSTKGCTSSYSFLNNSQPQKKVSATIGANLGKTSNVLGALSNTSTQNNSNPVINARYSPPAEIPLPEKGKRYINLGVTAPALGIWGVATGVKIDRGGYAPYLSTGFVGKRIGGSATYGFSGIENNSESIDLSGFAKGRGGSISWPYEGEIPNLKNASYEAGFGTTGVSITTSYTFNYHAWSDQNQYQFRPVSQLIDK